MADITVIAAVCNLTCAVAEGPALSCHLEVKVIPPGSGCEADFSQKNRAGTGKAEPTSPEHTGRSKAASLLPSPRGSKICVRSTYVWIS